MTYKNLWFDGRYSRRQLPGECIEDCSRSGPADQAVKYWLERLQFDGPAWLIREHLKGYGAWEPTELADHKQNLARLLWIWANDCAENPGSCDYFYLG